MFVVDHDQSVRNSLISLLQSVDLRVEAFRSPAEFLSRSRPETLVSSFGLEVETFDCAEAFHICVRVAHVSLGGRSDAIGWPISMTGVAATSVRGASYCLSANRTSTPIAAASGTATSRPTRPNR